jgi:hypothetical protein
MDPLHPSSALSLSFTLPFPLSSWLPVFCFPVSTLLASPPSYSSHPLYSLPRFPSPAPSYLIHIPSTKTMDSTCAHPPRPLLHPSKLFAKPAPSVVPRLQPSLAPSSRAPTDPPRPRPSTTAPTSDPANSDNFPPPSDASPRLHRLSTGRRRRTVPPKRARAPLAFRLRGHLRRRGAWTSRRRDVGTYGSLVELQVQESALCRCRSGAGRLGAERAHARV